MCEFENHSKEFQINYMILSIILREHFLRAISAHRHTFVIKLLPEWRVKILSFFVLFTESCSYPVIRYDFQCQILDFSYIYRLQTTISGSRRHVCSRFENLYLEKPALEVNYSETRCHIHDIGTFSVRYDPIEITSGVI